MFGLTTRNNNQGLRTYNPFREMEELERAFSPTPLVASGAIQALQSLRLM